MNRNILIILGCILIIVILILFLTINNNKNSKNKKSKSNIKINSILVLLLVIIMVGINVLIRNNNSNDTVELYLEDNEILYENYIYKLPEGWRINNYYKDGLNVLFNTTIDDIPYYNGGIINIQKMTNMKYGDSIFKDMSFFENALKKNHTELNIGEGKMYKRGKYDVIVFPCEYIGYEDTKFLFAFMQEDESSFYNIQFYTNKVVDNEDELCYNYEDLNSFIDFLNNKEKENDRLFRTHNTSLKKDDGSLKVFEESTDEE